MAARTRGRGQIAWGLSLGLILNTVPNQSLSVAWPLLRDPGEVWDTDIKAGRLLSSWSRYDPKKLRACRLPLLTVWNSQSPFSPIHAERQQEFRNHIGQDGNPIPELHWLWELEQVNIFSWFCICQVEKERFCLNLSLLPVCQGRTLLSRVNMQEEKNLAQATWPRSWKQRKTVKLNEHAAVELFLSG